jgi:hypothetical protein
MTDADGERWPPDKGVKDPTEQRAIWRRYVPSGWHGIYDDLIVKLEAIEPSFMLSQAKEKLGGLRVHLRGRLRNVHAVASLTLEAEDRSYRTCAECGAPGRLCVDSDGWMLTVCELHAEGYRPYVAPRIEV